MENCYSKTRKSNRLKVISLFLLSSSSGLALAQQNYEAKICFNCDQTEARQLALSNEFEPKITCYADDEFSPDYQQSCHSQSNKVLIANASSGQVWGFEVYHENQGQWEHQLNFNASSLELSNEVVNLMRGILDSYEKLDEFISETNAKWQNPVSDIYGVFSQPSAFSSTSSAPLSSNAQSNCPANSPVGRAAKAAYDVRARTAVQTKVRRDYAEKYPNPSEAFEYRRLNGVNFSAGAGAIGIGGTWTFVPQTRLLGLNFDIESDVPTVDDTPQNQIFYNVFEENNVISIGLNEDASTIDGIALNQLSGSNLSGASACLIEQLNKYIEASVTSSGSAGGNFGNSEPPINLGRGLGRIPSGGSGGQETCTWRFYVRGEEAFSMQGPCP